MSNSVQTVAPSGSGVIQIVNSTVTAASTFVIPHVNQWYNVTGLTISITPKVATSKIILAATLNLIPNSNTTVGICFAKNGFPLTIGNGGTTLDTNTTIRGTSATTPGTMFTSLIFDQDIPGSTTTQTYTIQAYCATASSSLYINRTDTDTASNLFGRFISEIIAMEVL